MHFITEYIRDILLKKRNPERIKAAEAKIFTEGFRAYGIIGGKSLIKKIITAACQDYGQPLDFKTRLTVADELFQSRMYEECQAAILILQRGGREFDESTLKTFLQWIDKYVENWAVCDSLCIGLISQYFQYHPKCIADLYKWTRTKNRWKKRAACVTLSKLCREGKYLGDVVNLAGSLLSDKDIMVQKGVGWLLKEASRTRADEIIEFLNLHRHKIPSLIRSYAMEHMTPFQKSEVLK